MRLECGVGFHQVRTCRRTRPGQLRANTRSPEFLLDHRIGSRDQTGRYSRPRLFAVFRLITNSKRDRRIWEMLLFLVHFRFGSMRQVAYYHPSFPA